MMRYFKKPKNIARAFAGAWLGLFGVGMMSDNTALARTNDGNVFGQIRGDESFSQLPRKADYKNMPYVPGKTWLMINGTEPGKSIPGQVVRVVQELTGQQLIKIKDPDQPGVFYTDATIDPKHPFMEDPSIGLVKGKFGMKPFHGSMEDDAMEELAKLLAVVDAENKAGRIAAVVKPSVVAMPTLMAARSNNKPKAPVVAARAKKSEAEPAPRAVPARTQMAAVAPVILLEQVVPAAPSLVAEAVVMPVIKLENVISSEPVQLAAVNSDTDFGPDGYKATQARKALNETVLSKWKKPAIAIASLFGFTVGKDNSTQMAASQDCDTPDGQSTVRTANNTTVAVNIPSQSKVDEDVAPARDTKISTIFAKLAKDPVERKIGSQVIKFQQIALSTGEKYQVATDSWIANDRLRAYQLVDNKYKLVDLRDTMLSGVHDKLIANLTKAPMPQVA